MLFSSTFCVFLGSLCSAVSCWKGFFWGKKEKKCIPFKFIIERLRRQKNCCFTFTPLLLINVDLMSLQCFVPERSTWSLQNLFLHCVRSRVLFQQPFPDFSLLPQLRKKAAKNKWFIIINSNLWLRKSHKLNWHYTQINRALLVYAKWGSRPW